MKRLMITGAGGFVAGSVLLQAKGRWETLAIIRKPDPAVAAAASRTEVADITDSASLRACFEAFRPDAVIHTAALADIDYCEQHPEQTYTVNATGSEIIAAYCAEYGCRLVFCSTDTVFDGKRGMYTETDVPTPVNAYARSKAEAERLTLSRLPNSAVARLSLVLGIPLIARGNAFLPGLLRRLSAGEAAPFPSNEIRTPVDVVTVGAALLELAENAYRGFLHLSGNTRLSRYEMACRIARHLGYPETLIQPVDSSAMPDRAPRPADVSLDNTLAQSVLSTPMLSLEEGLDLSLRTAEEIFGNVIPKNST